MGFPEASSCPLLETRGWAAWTCCLIQPGLSSDLKSQTYLFLVDISQEEALLPVFFFIQWIVPVLSLNQSVVKKKMFTVQAKKTNLQSTFGPINALAKLTAPEQPGCKRQDPASSGSSHRGVNFPQDSVGSHRLLRQQEIHLQAISAATGQKRRPPGHANHSSGRLQRWPPACSETYMGSFCGTGKKSRGPNPRISRIPAS